MAYSKNTWKDGDLITAAKINNIEEGLNDIDDKAVTSITVGETQYLPTGGSVQIPAYPSKVSDLANDSNFITSETLEGLVKSSDLETLITSLGYVKESRVQELINAALAKQSANQPEV